MNEKILTDSNNLCMFKKTSLYGCSLFKAFAVVCKSGE